MFNTISDCGAKIQKKRRVKTNAPSFLKKVLKY